MANGVRIKIGLKCQENGDINYTTWKNPKTHTEKFEVKKYSPRLKNTLYTKKLN